MPEAFYFFPNPWVRVVDGHYVLAWYADGGAHTRPLTWRERLAWYWLQRVPKP